MIWIFPIDSTVLNQNIVSNKALNIPSSNSSTNCELYHQGQSFLLFLVLSFFLRMDVTAKDAPAAPV